ncbi:MAG: helix-turn-helix domain-containing protein [Actinomycetota bacterium]|nr:helix-turn-helix domain-containing protein [Actinomycetota bacterium]
MAKLATSGVRITEAARRLGIDGADVHRMLFAGELEGGPGRDGMVYFDEASIDAYLERHGFGVVAESSTGSSTGSTRTSSDESTPVSRQKSRKRRSDTPSDTQENGPSSASDHS